MADQIPTQPEQPEQVPSDHVEQAEKPVVPSRESERGMSPEMPAPSPSGEGSDKPLQGSAVEPLSEPAEPPRAAEGMPQEPEGTPESSENFPCPFDEDIGYEIVEPPEGEESDDGFASIPPGPTEEVNFEPPRVRGPRRRRDRGRREAARAGAPAPGMEPGPAIKPFPIWLAIAGAVLLAAIIVVAIWLAVQRG
jgi:hypothetical protein